MYNWSVVLSKNNSAELETLYPEDGTTFHSKRNAQLFAESYVLDYIQKVDGMDRLEPFINLSSPLSGMTGLEVTRSDIAKIESDETITEHKRHYILSTTRDQPWGIVVRRVHIFLRPMTTIRIGQHSVEEEVEEEQEVEVEKKVLVPGYIVNSYRVDKVREKVKKLVKKQVSTPVQIKFVTPTRTVDSTDMFTIFLVRSKNTDQINPVEREQAILIANDLAKSFSETKTAKMILAVSGSDVPYKVSELISFNNEEFGCYHKQEKKKTVKQMVEKKNPIPPSSPVNIRRATTSLGVRTNTGASLAGIGLDVMKRRREMFPSKQDD